MRRCPVYYYSYLFVLFSSGVGCCVFDRCNLRWFSPASLSVKLTRTANNAASSSLHRSTMLLPSALVFLLTTCLAASAYTKLDWDKHDHFVIQHDPAGGASLRDCCRALDVELVEQVGQLDDHWLVRSQKHLAKRAESHPVIDTFNTLRIHAREGLDKRVPSSASAKDVVNSIKMLERQELRKRVKRELVPPSNSLQRRQQGLDGGAITSYAKKFDIKDPIFPTQWHYVNDQYPQHVMNVTGLWEMGVTGKGVISAMVDDGLDYESDDLAQNFVSLPYIFPPA
jgi:kexin